MDINTIRKLAGILTEAVAKPRLQIGRYAEISKGSYIVDGYVTDGNQDTEVTVRYEYTPAEAETTNSDSPNPASPASIDIISIVSKDSAASIAVNSVDYEPRDFISAAESDDDINESVRRVVREARRMAGMLVESDDDDDGMTAAERELAATADRDLRKKGVKVKSFDPDKNVGADNSKSDDGEDKPAAGKPVVKKETLHSPWKKSGSDKSGDEDKAVKPAAKPAEKAEKAEPTSNEKAEEKAEEKAAEAKRRGKAPDENSKRGKARAWLSAHPSARRREFLAYAVGTLEMGKHSASTWFASTTKRTAPAATEEVKEYWLLQHPQSGTYLLGENAFTNTYMWVDVMANDSDLVIFESEASAAQQAEHLAAYKNLAVKVIKVED